MEFSFHYIMVPDAVVAPLPPSGTWASFSHRRWVHSAQVFWRTFWSGEFLIPLPPKNYLPTQDLQEYSQHQELKDSWRFPERFRRQSFSQNQHPRHQSLENSRFLTFFSQRIVPHSLSTLFVRWFQTSCSEGSKSMTFGQVQLTQFPIPSFLQHSIFRRVSAKSSDFSSRGTGGVQMPRSPSASAPRAISRTVYPCQFLYYPFFLLKAWHQSQ